MDWNWNDKSGQYDTKNFSEGNPGMSFDNDGGYAMAGDERVDLPQWVIADQRRHMSNMGEDQMGSLMGNNTPVQRYLTQNRMSQQSQPIPDYSGRDVSQMDDDYLTEDEHRAEILKMTHPTSLMLSNPLMPAAQQMLGGMGLGTGQMPSTGALAYMNQFMEIPYSSGLGGLFPNNQVPINPSMPDGSTGQPPPNTPGGEIPPGYGHLPATEHQMPGTPQQPGPQQVGGPMQGQSLMQNPLGENPLGDTGKNMFSGLMNWMGGGK